VCYTGLQFHQHQGPVRLSWIHSHQDVSQSQQVRPISAKQAGIPVILSATEVVQPEEKDLSTVGEPLMKRRKVVKLKTNVFENQQ